MKGRRDAPSSSAHGVNVVLGAKLGCLVLELLQCHAVTHFPPSGDREHYRYHSTNPFSCLQLWLKVRLQSSLTVPPVTCRSQKRAIDWRALG
jgi:hypothetical protein